MNANKKRGMSILLILVLTLIILTTIQQTLAYDYGCCYHPDNFCQNTATAYECCGEDECPSSIFEPNTPCSETKCEWQGCCHQTCTMTQYKDCNYGFTPIAELAPTYTCDSAPECSDGCCLYLTSSNEVGECEIKTQQQCQPDIFYPNVQFYEGLTTSECNALCEQNITTTGILEGYVFDAGTNQPIENAKLIAAGLTTFTNLNGYYVFEELPQGTAIVVASANNYVSETESKTITANQNNFLDFFLEESEITGATLKGQLKNENDEGIFGFVYYSEQGVFTDFNGYFTINNIISGMTEFTAMSNYYIPKTEYIEILPETINTHDFILVSEQGGLCGNSVINFGEECEQDNDQACPGQCTNCQCPDTCTEAGGYCYTYEAQCEEAGGEQITISELDLCSGYSYQNSNSGCCNEKPVSIPPCIDGTLNNQPISGTEHPENINICLCGNQYINLTNSEAEGYCCDGEYHTSSQTCELAGTISGYTLSFAVDDSMINAETEALQKLPETQLSFTKVFTNEEFTTTSFENSYYLINLPKGNYSLLAEKLGYESQTMLISLGSAENKILNITLPKLSFYCTEENITQPILSASQTRGINKITLNWQQQCTEYIDHFEIYRDNQLIYTTTDTTTLSYEDSTTEWDTTYTYSVKAISFYAEEESNVITISPGSIQCENKFDDESWCFDSTKRVVCNDNNQPVLWDGYQRGAENGDCTKAIGTGSVCMSENDKSWCTVTEDCSQTGLSNNNIFGLFYNLVYPEKSCLYTDISTSNPTKRYCYYDSYQDESWTTVDTCLSCSSELTCFDYNSEDACLQDNCLIGERTSHECEWITSYDNFQVLGKGYCAPQDYTETDHCSDCSPSSELFLNTECSHDVCSNLGSCYSEENNTQCISCSSETTCESYTTEEDCIGTDNQAFSIPGNCDSSSSLQLSNDNCNLGRCVWKNNQCIKDGNADGKEDCSGNIDCLKDNTPPTTEIADIPNYINKEGATLLFEVEDNTEIENTYYCIGESCCPRTQVNNNTLFLNYKNQYIGEVEKFINITYYSQDTNKNTEQIKSTAIYFDTKSPEINLFYYIENSTNSSELTNLYINFSVSEESICTAELKPTSNKLSDTLIQSSKLLAYNDLQDGKYSLLIKCTDLHQNTRAGNFTIEIDRFHKIFDESPNLVALKQNNVTLSVKTEKDQLYCYYGENNQTQTTLNPQTSGLGEQYGEDYIYTKYLDGLTSASYDYNINCYNTPGGQLMDSSFISFTIDYLPPETNLTLLNPNGKYYEPESKPYSLLNIKLDCQDTEQEGAGEAGCGNTYFCIINANQNTTENNSCIPDSTYLEPETYNTESGQYTICYYSEDLLENKEETKCSTILIDNQNPVIEITNPEMQLTTSNTIAVNGLFYDTSDLDVFVKTRNTINQVSEPVQAETTFSQSTNSGTFTTEIELFEGYNQITATAYDITGKTYQNSVIIYYDNQGPGIKEITIQDTNTANDPDTDYILEYGSDISFEAKVNDYLYSDIYDKLKTDVLSVKIEISNLKNNKSIILAKSFTYNNLTDTYSFTYQTSAHPELAVGDYKAEIIMEDQFGNIASIPYILKIRDTIGYTLEVLNHNSKNILQTGNKGESGYPITLTFTTPKTNLIQKAELTLTNDNPAEYNRKLTLTNQDASFSYTLYDYLPEGNYDFQYKLTDINNKIYYDTTSFAIQDTLAPAFNITITKDNQPTTSVTYGIYNVIINSFEPIYEISSLTYSFNGKQDSIKDISGNNQNWQGKLHISVSETYQNIDNANAQFTITATDYNDKTGGNIILGKNFIINTKGPGQPVLFTPEQTELTLNSPELYVSGHTPDWQGDSDIVFKVNQLSNDLIAPGWETLTTISPYNVENNIGEWKTSLYGEIQLLAQDKIRVNDPEAFLKAGNYFDFATEKTDNYLYREVLSAQLYSDPDGEEIYYDITFTPELETNISNYQGMKTSENLQIYNTKYPIGWFETTLTLPEGMNYLVAQSKDSAGNYGETSEIYQITYDQTQPIIDSLTPTPESYTNQERPVISASLKDTGSGIDKDSIQLGIYEENYTLSCGDTKCYTIENKQTCGKLNCFQSTDKKEVNISYLTPESYVSGWKIVNINVKDLANNSQETEWGFWLDGLTPSTPTLTLTPGNKISEGSPYTYYFNTQKPSIDLDFLAFETIELLDYYLKDQNSNQIANAITLSQLTDNTFEGSITQNLQEEKYYIYIEARKQFPNGSWSNNAHWNFPIELDQTIPKLTASLPEQTNGQDSVANISYTEKNPYYIQLSNGAQGTISNKDLSTPMQYLIELTESQGNKDITFTLYDKAGNTAQESASTYLDSIGPEVNDNYQYDNQWVSSPQTITLSAQDLNGIKEIKYCDVTGCNPFVASEGITLSQPYQIQFTEEQTTNISYGAYDTFNNPSEIKNFRVLYDITEPELNLFLSPNTNRQETIISGKIIDQNPSRVEFTGDLTPTTYYPQSNKDSFTHELILTDGEGEKTIRATAYDLAGNSITKEITTNLYYNSAPLSVSYIDGAYPVEDYYKSSENVLTIYGYHLFDKDVAIYSKNNPTNLATTTQNSFTLQISEVDGYTGIEGEEKSNIITLVAHSAGSENYELNVRIVKDDTNPEITVIEPSTYYTNSYSPNIIIETNEQSSCELNSQQMNSEDSLTHNFQFAQITKTTPITITCTDLSGNKETLDFDLKIDTTQPYIYYTDLYGAKQTHNKGLEYSFLLFVSEETSIEVFANEPVTCKYGTTTDYNSMTSFKQEQTHSSQQISNKLTLQNGEYTLYTICEDQAGNPSKPAKLNIAVNTNLPIQITDLKPGLYTNEKNPELSFYTYRNATCKISIVDGYNAVTLDYDSYKYKEDSTAKQETSDNLIKHSTIISEKAGSLEQKELTDNTDYAFEINCESNIQNVEDSETKYLYFTTDFTAPTITISQPANGLKTNSSYLSIVAETEPESNYTIYVNGQKQTYSTKTTNGNINDFAILQDGVNTILIKVIDKAGNTAQSRLIINYNNLGPVIESTNPSDNETLPPITSLSAQIEIDTDTQGDNNNNNALPSILDTSFTLFLFENTQTPVTNIGDITKQQDTAILTINNEINPDGLPEGNYRLYVIPKNVEGNTGEGKNILFTVGNNNPVITLSQPYNSKPYTGKITSKIKTEFEGLISSADLLKSELYINSELRTEFNEQSFNIYPELDNGLNNFVIKATTTSGDTTIIHGDITLDAEGPDPEIEIE